MKFEKKPITSYIDTKYVYIDTIYVDPENCKLIHLNDNQYIPFTVKKLTVQGVSSISIIYCVFVYMFEHTQVCTCVYVTMSLSIFVCVGLKSLKKRIPTSFSP